LNDGLYLLVIMEYYSVDLKDEIGKKGEILKKSDFLLNQQYQFKKGIKHGIYTERWLLMPVNQI